MNDEKVAEIRQQLLNISDCAMKARELVGLLHLDCVSLRDVLGQLRTADVELGVVFDLLAEEVCRL